MFKSLVLAAALLSTASIANAKSEELVASLTSKNANVEIRSVSKIINLAQSRTGLIVRALEVDYGPGTDVSPTTEQFLVINLDGEMSDSSAVFPLGVSYGIESAKKVSGGIYQIRTYENHPALPTKQTRTLTINAVDAINAVQNNKCAEDFGSCTVSATIRTSEKMN